MERRTSLGNSELAKGLNSPELNRSEVSGNNNMVSQILTIMIRRFGQRQRGITGLETAIVLIAFVVVSSVFAFAALSSGMFASDKARETHSMGLEQARSSMSLKGSVLSRSTSVGVTGLVSEIAFNVGLSAGGQNLDLTPGTMVIMFTDSRQNKAFGSTTGFTVRGLGRSDTDNLLERNEIYEITLINLDVAGPGEDSLTYPLGVNETFRLEIMPPKGSVLMIERTTPIYMDLVNFLQ